MYDPLRNPAKLVTLIAAKQLSEASTIVTARKDEHFYTSPLDENNDMTAEEILLKEFEAYCIKCDYFNHRIWAYEELKGILIKAADQQSVEFASWLLEDTTTNLSPSPAFLKNLLPAFKEFKSRQ